MENFEQLFNQSNKSELNLRKKLRCETYKHDAEPQFLIVHINNCKYMIPYSSLNDELNTSSATQISEEIYSAMMEKNQVYLNKKPNFYFSK